MKRTWQVIHAAFVALLVAGGFFALFRVWAAVALADQGTKDFWDIATAVGTCSAVVAALYISISDRRRRERDELVGARLTAAAITYRLGLLRNTVSHVRDWADESRRTDFHPSTFVFKAQLLEQAERCSFEQIRSLTALPGHCAIQIAGAQDRVDLAERRLAFSAHGEDFAGQLNTLGMVVTALLEAENLLAHAIVVCDREGQDVYAAMTRHV